MKEAREEHAELGSFSITSEQRASSKMPGLALRHLPRLQLPWKEAAMERGWPLAVAAGVTAVRPPQLEFSPGCTTQWNAETSWWYDFKTVSLKHAETPRKLKLLFSVYISSVIIFLFLFLILELILRFIRIKGWLV